MLKPGYDRSAPRRPPGRRQHEGDSAFHLETGITKLIGLHIRNDRFLDVPRTEAMFPFAAITSRDGMSGITPIICTGCRGAEAIPPTCGGRMVREGKGIEAASAFTSTWRGHVHG